MTHEINIEGLDKAAVLAALYNKAQPLGAGMLHYNSKDMTIEEARKIITEGDNTDYPQPQTTRFDYLHGRVMKIDLSRDTINTSV